MLNEEEVDQARMRIRNALVNLKHDIGPGRNLKLDTVAASIVNADALLSALSLIYDDLYDLSMAQELIGRKPHNPLNRATEKGK